MEPTLDNYKLSCELVAHSLDVRCVAVGAPDSIISGSRDKTVKVWKHSGKEYTELVTYKDHTNFIASVYYLEAERWICTGSNDTKICIYQADEGKNYVPIKTLSGHESTVCCLAGGVEPRSIVSGSWDKTARIWKLDQMGNVSVVVLKGHEAAVWSVATMPEVQKILTGSADKCIFYWNASGERLRILKGHTDCVRGVLTLPGQTSFVSCSNDATIRCWNDDGECVQELSGHTNYIYAIAQNRALGDEVIVSCGEDSSLRMWSLSRGEQLGAPIEHPACSVWSVACLPNGDIVTGASDGVVRVFTKEPTRYGDDIVRSAFELAVQERKRQAEDTLGGMKKTDLPGPEALLMTGQKEGQKLMVRHNDGSVKCYSWGQGTWNLIGEVTGASGGSQETSGKKLHEGKEYDYVFSVDISDSAPPIKLPYNREEDPWHAAQAFIHRNNLPQAYLEQVANFIIKNAAAADSAAVPSQPTTSGYQDPFTGGSRYVPGSSQSNFNAAGNLDPFTGASSYSTAQQKVDVNFVKGSEKHFPTSTYLTLDTCDTGKVLEKLKEFNNKLPTDSLKVSETLLSSVIRLAGAQPEVDSSAIEALKHLLTWPTDFMFPVLDITRLAIRNESICHIFNSINFIDTLLTLILSSAPNQLMSVRCLANMMSHAAGRQQIDARLPELVGCLGTIKSGTANLQIAIATFYLNVTISQTLGLAESEKCHLVTEGLVELLKWSIDLEACYRSMQAIGNLTTTPFGQETSAQVISVDYVMDKIRELTNTPQAGPYAKLNSVGKDLLAAF